MKYRIVLCAFLSGVGRAISITDKQGCKNLLDHIDKGARTYMYRVPEGMIDVPIAPGDIVLVEAPDEAPVTPVMVMYEATIDTDDLIKELPRLRAFGCTYSEENIISGRCSPIVGTVVPSEGFRAKQAGFKTALALHIIQTIKSLEADDEALLAMAADDPEAAKLLEAMGFNASKTIEKPKVKRRKLDK